MAGFLDDAPRLDGPTLRLALRQLHALEKWHAEIDSDVECFIVALGISTAAMLAAAPEDGRADRIALFLLRLREEIDQDLAMLPLIDAGADASELADHLTARVARDRRTH